VIKTDGGGLILPTVPLPLHLTASARAGLVECYRECARLIRSTLVHIGHSAPQLRDYHPHGSEAFNSANNQHWQRISKLHDIHQEFMELAQHCAGEAVKGEL